MSAEAFYILTPAGYLHEHASSDLAKHPNPELSLFLPECTLGAPTNANARSHKFHIEGKKAIGGDVGQKNGLFSMDASFSFRARSHDEMLEWWNDSKQLSKVYRLSIPLLLPTRVLICAVTSHFFGAIRPFRPRSRRRPRCRLRLRRRGGLR